MIEYALTPLAKVDIFEIWSYISEDSESAADRAEQATYDACLFVAEDSYARPLQSDLTTRSLRFWTLTRYPQLHSRVPAGGDAASDHRRSAR